MIGSRPLTDEEITRVKGAFTGHFEARNRALFIMGIRTGFRISELLSLRIGDVWSDGDVWRDAHVKASFTVHREDMKGKVAARRVPLHPEARQALHDYLTTRDFLDPDAWLFESQRRGRPMDKTMAWRALDNAYWDAGLDRTYTLGTHAMRKTFARHVHAKLGRDLVQTQRALGHKNINSTISYLGFEVDQIVDAAIVSL